MSAITTHVLDTARGRPAAGVTCCSSAAPTTASGITSAAAHTDTDGRLQTLYPGERAAAPGRLPADVRHAAVFRAARRRGVLSRKSSWCSKRRPARPHYHVPLLLSPFGYTHLPGNLMPRSLEAIANADGREPEARASCIRAIRSAANPSTPSSAAATRLRSDAAQRAGAQALETLNDVRADRAGVRRDHRPARRHSGTRGHRARARASTSCEREPVEDYGSISRTATAPGRTLKRTATRQSAAQEVAAGMQARHAAAVHRHSHQAAVARAARAQPAHARHLRDDAGQGRRERLPANFAVTVTKGHDAGARQRAGARVRGARAEAEAQAATLQLELMIETPQAILAPDGTRRAARAGRPAGGRVRGAHFGVYDYTALCGITAAWQHLRHLACDFAREMMRVSLAQTGVMLSDGSTNTACRFPPHVHDRWKTALRRRDAFAGERVLPGMGSASRRTCRPATPRSTRSICPRVRPRRRA